MAIRARRAIKGEHSLGKPRQKCEGGGCSCRQGVTDQPVLRLMYTQGSNITASREQFGPETPAAGPHPNLKNYKESRSTHLTVYVSDQGEHGPVEEN